MSRIAPVIIASITVLPLLSGCIIQVDDAQVNHSPRVQSADAGCYWDGFNRDYIWYFDAEVSDPNGAYDVVEVWADVFDVSGRYMESFKLFRDNQYAETWFSDWLQTYSQLDCAWRNYTVDIVAYDSYGQLDLVSTIPYQTP